MPKYILWLKEADKEDYVVIGTKAANFGHLASLSVPIPEGFTIANSAFFDFLQANSLKTKIEKLLVEVDIGNTPLLEETAALISRAIKTTKLPFEIESQIKKAYRQLFPKKKGLVALRPSISARFEVSLPTYLSVDGERELFSSLKEIWAALFSASQISQHPDSASLFNQPLAVIVQQMVLPEVSGALCTISPDATDKKTAVVTAVWGKYNLLDGNKIASGDIYNVAKGDFEITSKEISRQETQVVDIDGREKEIKISPNYQNEQKLPDGFIIQLAQIGRKIENNYGFPQEIDWSVTDNNVKILSNRTLISGMADKTAKTAPINLPVILKGSPAGPGIGVGIPRIITTSKDLAKTKFGDILVAADTDQNYLPFLKRASALVVEAGRGSHAERLSRRLGIPIVTGADKATKHLAVDTIVSVNGSSGKVYRGAVGPEKMLALEYVEEAKGEEDANLKTATKVMVNLGERVFAKQVASQSVDGVGLLRGETFIFEIGKHPKKFIEEKKTKAYSEKLASSLKEIASEFDPRPVIYRASDLKSNEYASLKFGDKYENKEANPDLGFRGALRYTSEPEVFALELEAIKMVRHKGGLNNLWLVIPFVRTVKEMEQVKKMVAASGLHRSINFKLLMMVEVPATVVLIEEFLDVGIDGCLIDLNDLTAMMLGLSKEAAAIEGNYDEPEAGVLKGLETVIRSCNKRGLYSSVYGQTPVLYPDLTEKLVKWGVSSLSVAPDSADKMRGLIYEAEKSLVSKKS